MRRPRRRTGAVLAAAGLALAVALGGAGLLVLPLRERGEELDRDIASARARLDEAATFARTYRPEALDSADLFRLAKAVPAADGMPGLLLQLDRIAGSAGVTVDSFEPGEAVVRGGIRTIPVQVTARGSVYAISDLLLRLRSAVRVRDGRLDVSGRLTTIDRLALSQRSSDGELRARLTLSAYAVEPARSLSAPATPPVPASPEPVS